MATSIKTPKVFISYSWKPITNKQKTISLAERMTSDGVNIILDEWNLSQGQDKYEFMEQMVNNPEIERVLIICNKDYEEKANQKKGGVGTESLIISDEIYKQADQVKFIPIIFEKNEKGEPYKPTFLSSRIYIDLSSADIFEDEYEKLLRNIFNKPASKRPPIGNPPSYLLEEELIFLRTSHKVNAIKDALINEKRNYQFFIDDYYTSFISTLSDFEIDIEEIKNPPFNDELVLKRIDELKYLRNDLISFFETIFTFSEQLNLEKFIDFLEKLVIFLLENKAWKNPHDSIGFLKIDQYRFFYYEIFLYLVRIMVEKEKFKELYKILNVDFIIYDSENRTTKAYSFLTFNQYVASLNKYRNDRLLLNRSSLTADIMGQRADIKNYSFDNLREVDILLYYLSIMRNETDDRYRWIRWFPQTTVYPLHSLPIFEKLASLRFFEKFKYLFGVNTIDEFKQRIEKAKAINVDKLERFDYDFPFFNYVFDFTKIGKYK